MPDKNLSKRITNEWQEIGFQGSDPATDFRGTGYLGLKQLLQMCSPDAATHLESLGMFRDSVETSHWYFFSVTGINISQKLLKSISKGDFDH